MSDYRDEDQAAHVADELRSVWHACEDCNGVGDDCVHCDGFGGWPEYPAVESEARGE